MISSLHRYIGPSLIGLTTLSGCASSESSPATYDYSRVEQDCEALTSLMAPLTTNKSDINFQKIQTAKIQEADKDWLYEQYQNFKTQNSSNSDFKTDLIIRDLELINKQITKLEKVNLISRAEAMKLAEDLDYRFITVNEASINSTWAPFVRSNPQTTWQIDRFQIERALLVLTTLSEKLKNAETNQERNFVLGKVAELIDSLKSKESLDNLRDKLINQPEFNPFLEQIPVHKNPEPSFLVITQSSLRAQRSEVKQSIKSQQMDCFVA